MGLIRFQWKFEAAVDVKGCCELSWPGSTTRLNLSGLKSVQQRPEDLQSDSSVVTSALNSASTEFSALLMEALGCFEKEENVLLKNFILDRKPTDQIYSASYWL